MREIGGYLELDTYHLPMLHEGAVALNCGRNALAYLLRTRCIKKLWIPKFICDSVIGVCEREQVPYTFYSIGMDFLPRQEIVLGEDEWLYFVNYYSQFDNDLLYKYFKKHKRIIVDNAQSYFQDPLDGVDTIYTCRKYFGVADGAFLFTNAISDEHLPIDESFKRMRFLLGRYERTASEFYEEYAANNDYFVNEKIKRMSKLTLNLLHGIDYPQVKRIREENYSFLHRTFRDINQLRLVDYPGTFMYPLLLEKGAEIRKILQQNNIYIPLLWPDVFRLCKAEEIEYKMASHILPLPVDQRYNIEDMKYMISVIFQCLGYTGPRL